MENAEVVFISTCQVCPPTLEFRRMENAEVVFISTCQVSPPTTRAKRKKKGKTTKEKRVTLMVPSWQAENRC
jgi:predicted metal-binding protein